MRQKHKYEFLSGMYLKKLLIPPPSLLSSLLLCQRVRKKINNNPSTASLIYNPDAHLRFCFVSALPHLSFPSLVTHRQDASLSEFPPPPASRRQDGEADGSRGAKHKSEAPETFCCFSFFWSLSPPLVWKRSRTAAGID